LALWAGLCQWHKGIAKSIFNAVSGKKKLKFAIDNIAHLLKFLDRIKLHLNTATSRQRRPLQ
ncbi:MAG: hypothetical protein NXI23_21210, partial [Bacteroidetes bacterium]|nr:hypothetical protein [Bacteroidota bacterium]